MQHLHVSGYQLLYRSTFASTTLTYILYCVQKLADIASTTFTCIELKHAQSERIDSANKKSTIYSARGLYQALIKKQRKESFLWLSIICKSTSISA